MMVIIMTNEEFKYWLSGYITLTSEIALDDKQYNIIVNHANLVKAIAGHLDLVNKNFITWLEEQIRQARHVPLLDVRTLYKKLYSL